MDVQRRVANKRWRNRSGRTPRKSKIYKISSSDEKKEDPSGDVEDNNHKQVSAKTAVGSGAAWVDNSFGRNELTTEVKKDETDYTITPRRSGRHSAKKQQELHSQVESSGSLEKCTKPKRKSATSKRKNSTGTCQPTALFQTSPTRPQPDIFTGITSTPKRQLKCSSPEPYVSQHDSFNESDPLLAEMDMLNLPDLPQAACAANKANVSCSKTNKPTTNRLHSENDIFTSNSSISNQTLFGSSTKMNPTHQTPHNFKTLSQVLSDHNYSPPDASELDINKPVATSRSLKDKLRKAMQENAKNATPQSTRQQKLKAESVEEAIKQAEAAKASDERDIGPFYGLPSKVKQLLEEQRGISELYNWQHECLTLDAVVKRRNLIYSLPTSGGKTLVAEILILKEILCRQNDAMLILPFVSIVHEKVRGMSGFALELDFFVEEYAAHKGQIPPRNRRKKKSLYICTIEKANSVINSLIETKRIENVGLCVVDELHMLGEGGSRGATLEMSLAKLIHMNADAQIVGMSATLSNIGDLAAFLNAHIYTNNFRPVELTEYVKVEDVLYKVNNESLVPEERLVHDRHVTFPYGPAEKKLDPDHITGLVQEVIPDHSCLVFCPTKKNCENVSELICKLLPRKMVEHKMAEKKDLLTALWYDGGGEICPTLKKTIPYGIAYHHSGLTMDERKLIEEAYSESVLCLLCCTSTLAAGVNLPAKRVILRSPYVGIDFLSRSHYKQMTGRAGRAGIDTSGESILVVQKRDKHKVLALATGPMEYCKSSLLYEGSKGMRQLLLTTVGLEITRTVESVVRFLRNTLCYVQSQQLGVTDMTQMATETLRQLVELGLTIQTRPKSSQNSDGQDIHILEVTPLGRAVFKGHVDADLGLELYHDICLALPPFNRNRAVECDRGPELYEDLKLAAESLVVANYLHMLYLVTPYDMVEQVKPNWMLYLDELGSLDQAEQKVASLVGVSEGYVARQISGQCTKKGVNRKVVSRFYLTLVLYNLWRQKTVWQVSAKFQLPRGFIQNFLNSATSFASCVLHFCQELPEFWAYQDLFSNFVKRLSYCHVADLIPLLEIPGVKIGRARQLYKAGYKSLQHIASADPEQLVRTIEHMPRKIAKQLVTSAQMVLQEKAEALMEEAEEIITIPSDMPVGREVEISASQQFSEELSVSFSQL